MKFAGISNSSFLFVVTILSFVCLSALAQSNAPKLSISLDRTNVNLCWNTNFPDFALECTDHLDAVWKPVAIVTNCSIAMGANAGKRFFRLKNAVTVTYLGNEGFFFSGDGKKVLIDGIFSDGMGRYYAPPGNILTKERYATAPFDNVDALLFTHNHSDHINGPYTLQHMTTNQAAVLIGSSQVVDFLKGMVGYSQISNRVMTASPGAGLIEEFPISGIGIKTMSLQHGGDSTGSIQHLGFLFKIGGVKFFHPGDTANSLQAYQDLNLAVENIDVLFCPLWILDNIPNAQAIIGYLNPRVIIVMHVQMGLSDYYRGRLNSMTNLPPAYLLDSPPVTLRLPADES